MLKYALSALFAALAVPVSAAQLHFDLSQYDPGQSPTGFVSVVSGEGHPGDWKIVDDQIPPLMPASGSNAPALLRGHALAQTARDQTDEHFPILLYTNEPFGDFTLTTHFKTVAGIKEQMAGIAFRCQDARNFYVVRASVLGGNLRFYKVVGGMRSVPVGVDLPIATGVWHELKIQCVGNQIRCFLDGAEPMPAITDSSFTTGKIGYWTKSDSEVHFVDTTIDYTRLVPLAQRLVDEAIKKYPRLLGVAVFTCKDGGQPRIIASNHPEEVGAAGGQTETDTLQKGTAFHTQDDKFVAITLPLRDRNGEIAVALRVTMIPRVTETKESALARALPIQKGMETQMQSMRSLDQ